MVRRFAVLASFALAGCAGLKDALSAHQDVVARAAGQELTVAQLAGLIGPAKNVPLRRDVMDRVAGLWVDYQLLGQAVASGDSLLDSAAVFAANWPQVAQRLADRLHDTMIVARARLSARQVDSAYDAGNARWLDHILVLVQQGSKPEVKAAKRREAESYLAQLRRGADFGRLAHQKSGDAETARSGGSLGLVLRGQMDRGFEQAAWELGPGEYSAVVETPFGYHVIWRPRLDQVRDSFAARVQDQAVARRDSLFLDSLNKHSAIEVRSSAPAAVRAAVENLQAAKQRRRVLATYGGGQLTEADLARWLQAFAPQTIAMIGQANDSMLSLFVKSIARNAMLIDLARSQHLQLTAADRDSISGAYRRDLQEMKERLGVAPESLAADTAARRSRPDAIARRVSAYFDDIISSSPRHAYFDIQPFLADVLRGRYQWDVSPLGVDRALARARELRGPATPAAPAAPGQAGPTKPAPGGPPMSPRQPAPQAPRPAPSAKKSGS